MCECEDQDMGPEFYRIVHPTLNTTQHLRIPPDFVKHLPKEESGVAAVEGPSGHCWRVKFYKTEDGAFLTDGWNDFIRDHSLGNYELLVFRYDGEMYFYVQIFDQTACEKLDAFTVEPSSNQEPAISRGGNNQGNNNNMLVLVEPNRRRRGRPLNNRPQLPPLRNRLRQRRLPTKEEKQRALSIAESFSSELHRPHFVKCLRKSMVYTSYVMSMPNDFVRDHMPKYNTEFILKSCSGKAWAVNYFWRGGSLSGFCGGWASFVIDNELEEDDYCVFELVGELEMCVHVFHC